MADIKWISGNSLEMWQVEYTEQKWKRFTTIFNILRKYWTKSIY